MYYADNTNEEYKNKRDMFKSLYYDYETFRATLIYEISDSRDLLKQFFDGYTDEEIDFEIDLATKKKEDKYKQLKEEITDIEDEFDQIESSTLISDKTNETKILDILYRFVNKNKELSEYLGFDSYVYYKDISYNRIYTETDVNNFISNTKKYLVPLMGDETSFIDYKVKSSKLSYPEYAFLYEYEQTSIFDSDYKTKRLLDDYAKKIGGSYYKTYTNFFDKGHYVFSNNSSALNSAYTNDTLSYFGPKNQDANTVAHEFGHFYSMNNSTCMYKSLDLQEFYSQANEFLFNSYLEQYAQKNLKNAFDVQSCILINTACQNILLGTTLREYENRIYSETLSTPADLLEIWNDINDTGYNGKMNDYWKIEVRYDIYYLSYATSVTGALALYENSKTNFSNAAKNYIIASNNSNADDDIEEVLKKANLVNPFSEEAFVLIKKLIEEKS